VRIGQALADRARQALLVGRVEVGKEEADRHGLGPCLRHGVGDPVRLVVGQRDDDAVRSHALAGAHAVVRGHERPRLRRAEPVQGRAVLTADLQHVLEPLGRHQRGSGAALLQERVRSDGHSVDEAAYGGGSGARRLEHFLDRLHDSLRLVTRRGGRLGGEQLGPIEGDRVREGPADVHSQQHERRVCLLDTSLQ
jgi:hypothetical protein